MIASHVDLASGRIGNDEFRRGERMFHFSPVDGAVAKGFTGMRRLAQRLHRPVPVKSKLFRPIRRVPPHAVLDVVINDEVEFFVGESVVVSQNVVNLVEQRLLRSLVNRDGWE